MTKPKGKDERDRKAREVRGDLCRIDDLIREQEAEGDVDENPNGLTCCAPNGEPQTVHTDDPARDIGIRPQRAERPTAEENCDATMFVGEVLGLTKQLRSFRVAGDLVADVAATMFADDISRLIADHRAPKGRRGYRDVTQITGADKRATRHHGKRGGDRQGEAR